MEYIAASIVVSYFAGCFVWWLFASHTMASAQSLKDRTSAWEVEKDTVLMLNAENDALRHRLEDEVQASLVVRRELEAYKRRKNQTRDEHGRFVKVDA